MVKTEGGMTSLPHETRPLRLEVNDVTISYSGQTALAAVNLQIHENEIFGIIGPANSGKTSFLKALNRMDMFNPAMQVDGLIRFNGKDIRKWRNVYSLRSRIGVVFPLPVGLPMTVYENVALAPRLAGVKKKADRSWPPATGFLMVGFVERSRQSSLLPGRSVLPVMKWEN